MKLKINKACDLNSISVLPPQARKLNIAPTGPPASQLRSQQSQQSFSQSQHGMFSQLSQNSRDDILTNDQRFGSQERDNSAQRLLCLAPNNYPREENQMAISRTSTNMMRKWNSASVSDHKCQVNEELEHRIGMMETSVNRTGMILNSVQSDIMQVNKGTKEASLEMEGIQQKLTVFDNSLQLMKKVQEDIKVSFDEGLKAISDQLRKDVCREKLQEVLSMLSALPLQFEACLQKLQNDLSNTLTKEMQVMAYLLKTQNQISSAPTKPSSKGASEQVTSQERQQFPINSAVHSEVCTRSTLVPKIEMGRWNLVKKEQGAFTDRGSNKQFIQKGISLIEQEREWRVIIDSDEEIDGGFSCLLEGKEKVDTGNFFDEAKEETRRILRNARRRKRKYCNTIIIN